MSKRLIDDCFLHDGMQLSHAMALEQLQRRIDPVAGHESVALADAVGRTLAAAVIAAHPVPNHTNSAVDGFAFAAADYRPQQPTTFPVAGRSAAGRAMDGPPSQGAAVRIFTGAVMPDGLDIVAMQEDCQTNGQAGGGAVSKTVTVPAGLKPGANVRRAGEDVARDTRLYEAGHIVRPQDLAALASLGLGRIDCFARLRIGIVSTGDEVIRAGAAELPRGKVFDANAPMLAAFAGLIGATPIDLGIWPDSAGEVQRRLTEAATRFDVILTSGGASRGEEDHIGEALAALGERHFWQIKVKPGRPMMLGQIGDTVVVGLPGNPVAVFVCFLIYVWPMLRRLGGASWVQPRRLSLPARFAFPDRKTGRREFWRGMMIDTPDGLMVDKYRRDGSGLISSLREADCLIDIEEAVEAVNPGDHVSVIPFTEFGIPRI